MQIKTKIVSCHSADFKPVKQDVNGTVMLPPLVFPANTFNTDPVKCRKRKCTTKIDPHLSACMRRNVPQALQRHLQRVLQRRLALRRRRRLVARRLDDLLKVLRMFAGITGKFRHLRTFKKISKSDEHFGVHLQPSLIFSGRLGPIRVENQWLPSPQILDLLEVINILISYPNNKTI